MGSTELPTEVMRSLQKGSAGVMGGPERWWAWKRDLTGRVCRGVEVLGPRTVRGGRA